MAKTLLGLAALASALALSGCATSTFNGYSDEPMAQIAIVQNPDMNGGKISPKAMKKIGQYSLACQGQIDAQLAGLGQSAVNGAVPYTVAGAGTGPAAKVAFGSTVSMSDYAWYGGLAYLLPGAVNGMVSGSYSMASAKGDCTRQFWEDVAKTDRDFAGTHVVIVYAGKKWGNSAPPALDKTATFPPPPPVK